MKNEFAPEKKELVCTFVNLIVIKMFFTYPRMMLSTSGNAAWIQFAYAGIISFFIFLCVSYFYKNAGCENIFVIAEKIGKKPMRLIFGTAVVLILTVNLAENMRIFPETIRTVLLPETPVEMTALLFIISIAVGAYTGIYSICRIHSLFMPIVGVVMLFFVIILIPDININNIFPLVGTGTQKIFGEGISSVSLFSDMMLIYIILPFCKNKRDAKSSMSYAFLIGTSASVIILLVYCLVYPYPISGEFILPVYQLARIANIGKYFQRFDAFFEFAWSVAMLLYASFYLYVICYSFCETFELEYYKELIVPFALLAAGIGFIPTNFVTFISDSYYILNIFKMILYAIPLLIGISFKIKKGGEGHKNI